LSREYIQIAIQQKQNTVKRRVYLLANYLHTDNLGTIRQLIENEGGSGIPTVGTYADLASVTTPMALVREPSEEQTWGELPETPVFPLPVRMMEGPTQPEALPPAEMYYATLTETDIKQWAVMAASIEGDVPYVMVITTDLNTEAVQQFIYVWDTDLLESTLGVVIPQGWNEVDSSGESFTPCTAEEVGTINADEITDPYGFLPYVAESFGLHTYPTGLYAKMDDSWMFVGPKTVKPGKDWMEAPNDGAWYMRVSESWQRTVAPPWATGRTWAPQQSIPGGSWNSITYGNGSFVTVGSGGDPRVITSPDGITWTAQQAAANINWYGITYGNGLFVAVAQSGAGNRVMTSPDGINWTSQQSAADNYWNSVTYGNGLFVAVGFGSPSGSVMTSPEGITWTTQQSATNNNAAGNNWNSVAYGNGLFVAVTGTIVLNHYQVMTSPDGITWTARQSADNNTWNSVTYGNGLFVAVGSFGAVMTSPDGITWTLQQSAVNNNWNSVTYGNGLFVAVANTGTGNRVMTSPDGIVWTSQQSAANAEWSAVTYGNGLFVAVANSGIGSRVMTAP